ncbi:uncharacterized protein KQ657_003924, partial [Scheffersomyces spartinae]
DASGTAKSGYATLQSLDTNQWTWLASPSTTKTLPPSIFIPSTTGGAAALSIYFQTFYWWNIAQVEFRMYFFADETGSYTFELDGDDLVYLFVGSENAFPCCRETVVPVDALPDFSVVWNSPGTVTYDFTSGTYYPMRLLFGGGGGPMSLGFRYQNPGGTWFGNSVFTTNTATSSNLPNLYLPTNEVEGSCQTTTTITNSNTAVKSTITSSSVDRLGTLYYDIYVPLSYTVTTTTLSDVVGSTTTATSVGADGSATIIVEMPSPTYSTLLLGTSYGTTITSTGITYWASSASQLFTTTDNGVTKTLFGIPTPEPSLTINWTGSDTSTLVTTIDGSLTVLAVLN